MSKSDNSARFENRKYRALFENSITALFITRTDGTIMEANPAACRLFGYTEEEFKKLGRQGITDPNSPGLSDKLKELKEKGSSAGEMVGIRKNGKRFWCEFSMSVFDDPEDGTIASMVLIDMFNSSDRQESLKGVMKNVPGVIYRYVTDFERIEKTEFVSGEVKQVLGFSAEEVFEDKSLGWKNIHEDDVERVIQSMNESASKNKKWICEYRYHHPDGSIRWLRGMGNPIRKEGDRVVWDSIVIDITEEKQSDVNYKLMESVVTEANDAVLITKANPVEAPDGPEIIYVNRSFEKISGYKAKEVIGKTPRILQGPYSESDQLQKLRNAVQNRKAVEVELLNYSKNGDEYWVNISLTPIFEGDICTHFISIQKDITERKLGEIKKSLLSEVSRIFNKEDTVKNAVQSSLDEMAKLKYFDAVELWLVDREQTCLNLAAYTVGNPDIINFYEEEKPVYRFKKGEGLPGATWKKKDSLFWRNLDRRKTFIRNKAAANAGLKTGFSFPLMDSDKVIGVLTLFVSEDLKKERFYVSLFNEFSKQLASEIKRKELEEELSRIFNSAPDVICIAGLDGYYKKVNPAMSELLGYSEEELISTPIIDFVHPDDREKTEEEFEALNKGKGNHYFENRHITKSGQVIWLSWTTKPFYDEGITYSVAKDITEEKELRELLDQANRLAKIGSWEVDLVENKIYWSKITREVLDVSPDEEPSMDKGLEIYKEGESRKKMTLAIEEAIESGTPWDIEVQVLTSSGIEKWVRSIGDAEMVDGRCVRLYGSLQDIQEKKSIGIRLKSISNNFPGVLFQYQVDAGGNDALFYVSEGSNELWGISPEEAMSDNDLIWSRFHKEDFEKVNDSIRNSAESLTTWHSQWRYYHPDGSVRWQEGIGTPQKLADGSVLWDSVVLDVTEQRKLEELVSRTTRMAKIGSWELDLQKSDNEMYWSSMTREILEVGEGYNPTLTGGFEFYSSESINLIEKAVEKAINKGEPFDLELLIITANGKEKWIRCIGQSEIVDGECIRLYGSYQDIHLRKVTELELEERNRHINAIAGLNAALLNYTEWFEALENHFEMIGEAVQADRVYYFENRFAPETGEGFTTQKLEWCREGIISQMGNPDLDEMPFKELGQLIEPMIDGGSSMAALSEVAEGTLVRDVMESQGIKSFLTIPVNVHGKFHGFIGFDNCTDETKWSDQEVRTLKTITSNLAVAIERNQTENERKELLKEKNQILESISDAFYALDENWQITYFNSEAENLLGKKWENIVGNTLWEVFPAAKETELYEIYSEVKEEKVPQSFEYFYPPLNSWYDISAYPAEKGISVYFKNIDDRKEAQEKIVQKTRQLDAIANFNSLLIQRDHWKKALEESLESFGIVAQADRAYYFENVTDEEGRFKHTSMRLEWVREGVKPEIENPDHQNQRMDQISEYYDDLSANLPFNMIVSEIEDPEFKDLLKNQDIKSLLLVPVFVNRTFSGFLGFDDCRNERTWVEEDVTFLQTISINLGSVIENEDAEEALQKAFEEKNEILESIGDGFFALDRDLNVTYWNHQAEKLTQTPRAEVIGKSILDVFEDAEGAIFNAKFLEVLEKQETLQFEDYFEPFESWYEISVYPSSLGLSVFFKDITERIKADERLKELNRELEQQTKELGASNAELEQFAFVASHDLQEPLRMITSFLAQLERKYGDKLDEKGKKYIHFATDGAKRMRQIILDLLDYSRVGRTDAEKDEVDINEILDVVIGLHQKLIQEKKATVTWEEMPTIRAVRGPIQQLLQNLVHNALSYQEKGERPVVKIWSEEADDHWKFYVQDNGIGIDPEYKDKIFNIFQRLHGRDEYSGTGVGLAICKKIVEDHGGEIGVDSEEGEGSTFYFTISKGDDEGLQ